MITDELPAGSHVVVINRWGERYALYEQYLDHECHTVSYVATEVGLGAVPDDAAAVLTVAATDDLAEARAAVAVLASRHGAPAAVVALKEDDLLVGAALREEWGCPGPSADQILPFRNKAVMGRRVAEAGLAVPSFAAAPSPDAVCAFAESYGWPVIVKPAMGSSSAGVVRLDEPSDVYEATFDDEPRIVQAFNACPIFHVDGVFDGARVITCRTSRYLNTCLAFRLGGALGSIEEDDPMITRAAAVFTEQVLRALTDRPTVFHHELFFDERTGKCAFLEVGARVGGAEVPLVWRELHGYDLMEAAFRLQLGLAVPDPPSALDLELGGWLLISAPARRPCRIAQVTPMVGRRPGPYAESLLSVGEVLPAADSYYEHVGGRFRFRGTSSEALERAVTETATAFRVSADPAP
jgi:biotin carboxylase